MSDSMVGGVISGIGSLYSGRATQNALDAQADINDENAQLDIQQGDYNAMRQGMVVSQKLGAMKAAYGANGVSSNSGSVLDVLQQSATNGEMDTQNILHGAAIKAVNYQNEASMERLGASNAVTASYINAFSSVAGGTASAFGQQSSSNGGNGGNDDGESDEVE